MNTAAIVGYDSFSPYGMGRESLWEGLLSGRTAILPCSEFNAGAFRGGKAALVPLSSGSAGRSRVMRILGDLLAARPAGAPPDAALIIATTIGEIDLLEDSVLRGQEPEDGRLTSLIPKVRALTGAGGDATVISAACASSTAALARALMMIRSSAAEAVLVVAVDGVSEFLFSGFSALMALDEEIARPFDRDRAGLTIGEAAGYLLLMSPDRARREGHPVLGRLIGAAMTNDANHMTGPDREGAGLTRAIRRALADGGLDPDTVALVAAHGTGTRYNDEMEIKALTAVFGSPRPSFSIKGGIGHTMGSAGLLQAIAALEALDRGVIPPSIGVREVNGLARGWISPKPTQIRGQTGLVINAGFGGINAAVVLTGDREG